MIATLSTTHQLILFLLSIILFNQVQHYYLSLNIAGRED